MIVKLIIPRKQVKEKSGDKQQEILEHCHINYSTIFNFFGSFSSSAFSCDLLIIPSLASLITPDSTGAPPIAAFQPYPVNAYTPSGEIKFLLVF